MGLLKGMDDMMDLGDLFVVKQDLFEGLYRNKYNPITNFNAFTVYDALYIYKLDFDQLDMIIEKCHCVTAPQRIGKLPQHCEREYFIPCTSDGRTDISTIDLCREFIKFNGSQIDTINADIFYECVLCCVVCMHPDLADEYDEFHKKKKEEENKLYSRMFQDAVAAGQIYCWDRDHPDAAKTLRPFDIRTAAAVSDVRGISWPITYCDEVDDRSWVKLLD